MERIKLFIDALRQGLTASEDITTHLEGCIGCGNCGNACAWYLATSKEECHPQIRLNWLKNIYNRFIVSERGNLADLKEADLQKMANNFFSNCTMCGRCSLSCMQGVSNRRITWLGRQAFLAAGITPDIIEEIRKNSTEEQHSFGLSFENSVGLILESAKEKGIPIPVDKEGAQWLWVCSAILNSRYPGAIADIAKMLNVGGASYTISSFIKDTGTEAYTTCVDTQLGRQFIENLAKEAVRLGCQGLIVGECGCDVRIFHIEAADILNGYGLQVAYIDSLLLDLVQKGRIPIKKVINRVTYHDPCWTARLTGYAKPGRELTRLCAEKFIEMTPNHDYNYCCNGGAGSMRIWPAEEGKSNLRREVSVIKAEQIRQANADLVVTPCTTCFISLWDTVSYYNLKTKAEMVGGLLFQAMEAALQT